MMFLLAKTDWKATKSKSNKKDDFFMD